MLAFRAAVSSSASMTRLWRALKCVQLARSSRRRVGPSRFISSLPSRSGGEAEGASHSAEGCGGEAHSRQGQGCREERGREGREGCRREAKAKAKEERLEKARKKKAGNAEAERIAKKQADENEAKLAEIEAKEAIEKAEQDAINEQKAMEELAMQVAKEMLGEGRRGGRGGKGGGGGGRSGVRRQGGGAGCSPGREARVRPAAAG